MTAPKQAQHTPDGGLKLALSLASDDLDALREYFAERVDVVDDEGGDGVNALGVHASPEMALLQAVERIASLHARIAAGNPGRALDYEMGRGR